MSKKGFKDKDVLPGDDLAVIEVLQDGDGTYHEDGHVRAEELGTARYDLDKRRVTVDKKTRELVLPEDGLEVIAEVGSVMRRDARVDITSIEGRKVSEPFSGVIHYYDVDREFQRDMASAVRNGDIVKAKLINVKNRLNQLTIRGPDYGVVYAYCSRCGSILEMRQGRLYCASCDRSERRKFAKTYGVEELA
jgi:exosome complex component CSL4